MNKSLITNLLAVLLIIIGYFTPIYKDQILSIGFFALSGAVTNWLAVHMLFEKVPFLYGSGVIPSRFEDFKLGIKSLIMGQFFSEENIRKFFHHDEGEMKEYKLDGLVEKMDYHRIFNNLLEVVEESSFGNMLGMLGGVQALEPMRGPFTIKMKDTVLEVTSSDDFQKTLREELVGSGSNSGIQKKVGDIVDKRLEELTPQMVKMIISEMIRKHLGWLVVWGGVFGGVIGLGMSFIS